jgi:biopolymer transport protein ExbB
MSILNMILAQGEPATQVVQQATDTLQQTVDTAMQVVTDSAAAIAAATAPAVAEVAEPVVKELSVWDLVMAGGWWFMIPLALLAVVSIYIFFERFFAINFANRQDRSFMERIKEYIHRGEVDQALKLCQDTNTPYSRMIEKGVTRIGRPMNDVLVAIENVGNMEIAKLEKGFNWLATTAAGAPMIGFLGTVVGMVNAFFQLASAGNNSNVSILAGGIYQALVTTVAGLIVGIIALFAYNYLTSRVNKVMNKLEGKTMEFMDLLNEPAK